MTLASSLLLPLRPPSPPTLPFSNNTLPPATVRSNPSSSTINVSPPSTWPSSRSSPSPSRSSTTSPPPPPMLPPRETLRFAMSMSDR
ncbi:hypothetical protein CsSME_00016148 [Camellia sinensis var. sinensis]